MKYIVFNSCGEIIRTGVCADNTFLHQASPGQFVIEGEADDAVNYIENGVILEKPPRPSEYHRFDCVTKQWIDPRTNETQWPFIRSERDRRLLASDWTQLPDVPLATKEAWATYRQALRDVTLQPDPFNIVWPVAPG